MYKDYDELMNELREKQARHNEEVRAVTVGLQEAKEELYKLEAERDAAQSEEEYNTKDAIVEKKRRYIAFLEKRRSSLPKSHAFSSDEYNAINETIRKDIKDEQRKRAGEIAAALNKTIELMDEYAAITDELEKVKALASYLAFNSRSGNIERQEIVEAVEDPLDWFKKFTQMYFPHHDTLETARAKRDEILEVLNRNSKVWATYDAETVRYAKNMKG